MEDRGFHQWRHPRRGIIQKPLEPWRRRIVLLDDGLHLIGRALGATIASSYAGGECADRHQHNRCAPALVTRYSGLG